MGSSTRVARPATSRTHGDSEELLVVLRVRLQLGTEVFELSRRATRSTTAARLHTRRQHRRRDRGGPVGHQPAELLSREPRRPAAMDVDARSQDEALRRRRRGRRARPRRRRRGVPLAARPVGLRQDDDAPAHRRLRAAGPGRGADRRARRHRLPPYKRDVNTVFQSYALFPHLSGARQRHLRPQAARAEQGDRRARRSRCSSSCGCPDTRRVGRGSSPAASSSGSPSRARS